MPGITTAASDRPQHTLRRGVLLFARAPEAEAGAKRMPRAVRAFALAQERVRAAAAAVGAELLLVTPAARAFPGSLAQRGDSFGDRLQNALTDARARGFGELVLVPGDVPGLRAQHLRRAFAALATGRPVVGPSPDGGVYLVGLGPRGVEALASVPWRTSRVSQALRTALPDAVELAALADLDDFGSLRRLLTGADPELAQALLAALHPADPPAPREPRARLHRGFSLSIGCRPPPVLPPA